MSGRAWLRRPRKGRVQGGNRAAFAKVRKMSVALTNLFVNMTE